MTRPQLAHVTHSAAHPSHFFFFNDPAPTKTYTLSLHDALPILAFRGPLADVGVADAELGIAAVDALRIAVRSEEHTSELQSQSNLVCRLLLEKKKNTFSSLVWWVLELRPW